MAMGKSTWLLTSLGLAVAAWFLGGCEFMTPADPGLLRQRAVDVLAEVMESEPKTPAESALSDQVRQDAIRQQYQLQAQALEVLARFPPIVQSHWVHNGMNSPSAGVQYAALLAVGQLAGYDDGRLSRPYIARVRELRAGGNPFLLAAASYALYKLGEHDAVNDLPRILHGGAKGYFAGVEKDEAAAYEAKLRAEVVHILSLMPELGPEPLLRTVAEKTEPAVEAAARTRLAVLGDKWAIDQVYNMLNSGHADDRMDAAAALGEAPITDLEPLRQRLAQDDQAAVRMAAARALGQHGDASGLSLALSYLSYDDSERLQSADIKADPLHAYRVRFLAALALGAIGDFNASSGPLLRIMETSPSRRYRLAAARAALELLGRTSFELTTEAQSRGDAATR